MNLQRARQNYIEQISKQAYELFWMQPGLLMAARCGGKVVHRALDIGFDQGSSTIWLDLFCKVDTIVAIDISTDGVQALKENRKLFGTGKRLFIVQCNAEMLPFKKDTFDLVFMRSVLQYTDMQRVLTEVFFVSCSNGVISIIANCQGNPVIRFYRKFFKPDDTRANMQIRSYINVPEIRHLFNGNVKNSCFYNLITPLFYPVLEKYPGNRVIKGLFKLVCHLENLTILLVPGLRRFCWYCYIEVEK